MVCGSLWTNTTAGSGLSFFRTIMKSEDKIIKTYQKLSRGVYGLLHEDFGISSDQGVVWDSFARNLIEVLKIALDVSVTREELEQFHDYLQGRKPDQAETMRFWRDALERPLAYLVISYFYAQFVRLFVSFISVEKQTKYRQYLNSCGITEELLAEVEQAYQQVVAESGRMQPQVAQG